MVLSKWIFRAVTLSAALAIVAGCAAPAASPTTAPQATAAATSQKEVTVQYWSNGWFPESIGARQSVVDKFNQEYKGRIKVEYVQGNWDDQATYIQSGAAAGGNIACVMETDVPSALDWYSKGYIQNLKPYLTPERQALADDVQWQSRTFPDDGAIVANATVLAEPILTLIYNPDALSKAGITPATSDKPWTWQELYDNAKKLTIDANGKHLGDAGFDKNNVAQWGYVARLEAEKVWEHGLVIAQDRQGQPVVRKENGKWGWFLTDAAKETYKTYLSPVSLGITPPEAIGMGGDALLQIFGTGKAAIILRETFDLPQLKIQFPDFKPATMPIPQESGGKILYAGGGEGMVMPKSCQTPAEAAEFMFFVMRQDNAAVYAHGNGMLPGNLKALDQEPFKSDKNYDVLRAYLANAEPFVVPFNPHISEFAQTVVEPTLVDVASGKTTFEDAEKTIEQQADAILNQ
jgi:ABC-type glycerol-3-phosphate transport system substrate-binding protein